jgi:amino acid adenylation domain-containing protein
MPTLKGVEAAYNLSPLQQGLLFHSLDANGSGRYVDQFVLELEGELHLAALESAWNRALERHAILRTSFHWEGFDRPVQVVHSEARLVIQQHDWRQGTQLEPYLERDRLRGFDLSSVPLMRLALFPLNDRQTVLVWTVHHLILDGWSCGLIRDEVLAGYAAAVAGQPAKAVPAPPFSDYIAWLGRQDPAAAESFWKQELAGLTEPVWMESLLASPREPQSRPDNERVWRVPANLAPDLERLARQHRVTLSSIFQAAWAILIGRYTGRDDFAFGLTVSGRSQPLPGIERMTGNLINTVPFRVRLPADVTAANLFKEVHAANARIQRFEQTPLPDIQKWCGLGGNRPLFDSILVFENATPGGFAPLSGPLRLQASRHLFQINYPLVIQVSPGAELSFRIACESPRVGQAAIARMAGQLQRLLSELAANPDALAQDLPVLTAPECHFALWECNDTRRPYPQVGVSEAFERQVHRSPMSVALIHGDRTVTYDELNRRANRFARVLRSRGVKPETPVALYAGRSVEMVAALIGILKAGGVCVPIDPSCPPDRLALMLADSRAALVITEAQLGLDDAEIAGASGENLPDCPLPEQAAFLIYTSGSTGAPKGVVVVHRAIVRLVSNTNYVQLDGTQTSLAHSPSSFDACFFELFSTLLHGGRCVLFDGQGATPADVRRAIAEHGVDLLWLTASLFHLFVDEDPDALQGVKQLLAGGETLSPKHVARALERVPGITIINGYGPTEGTTFSTFYRADPAGVPEPVPLGGPIANTQVYVLDANLNVSPAGAIGEICIGGDGLARGYAHAPDLTAQRFVPDPTGREPGARLYRTGDLGRLLETGEIEFIGRADQQVKIRGFRVETGEVEAVLRNQPAIRDCAVTAPANGAGVRGLIAYLVPEAPVDIEALRRDIGRMLPEYMVPANFVMLDRLPRTPGGKLDRRALPQPAPAANITPTRVSRAVTPTVDILTGVWSAVLGIEHVQRDDNFFQLGGHSLLAIRALSRIREAFNVDLPLRALFEYQTLGELASAIERMSGPAAPTTLPPLTREPYAGELPLSFAQQRLWVLDELQPGIPAYNLPLAARLTGGGGNLPELLYRSIRTVVERHEVLRTTIVVTDGKPVQKVAARVDIEIPLIDLSLLAPADRRIVSEELVRAESVRQFRLDAGPLIRATLIQHEADEYLLLLTLHHIVADGGSLEVLFDEIFQTYAALSTGKPCDLTPLAVQYGDYARWQREWLRGELLEKLLEFWRGELSDAPPAVRLPADRPRPAIQTFRAGRQTIEFPRELASALEELARAERATPFMIMLAGFFALVFRYTGERDLVIGTPSANRNRVELEPLIGFFVNILALRARVERGTSFRELVAAVRESMLKAHAHQDLPFEKLVEQLQPERETGTSPYFQMVFAMHEAAPVRELEGVTLTPLETESVGAKFDLTMYVLRNDKRLNVSLEFNRDLFDSTTVTRFLENYKNLLAVAAEDAGLPVQALPLLSAAEHHQVLRECNDTQAAYPTGLLLHELFEAQAALTPDSVALKHGAEHTTYDQLNRRANRIAHQLRELGTGPEKTVGVFLRRSSRMVATLLAILKTGGAYVPLDPDYPAERVAFMLDDVQARIVVTEKSLQDRLQHLPDSTVVLDREPESNLLESNPVRTAQPGNMAYVIYTSGSTGRPKGIIIEHRQVVVLLHWVRDTFPPAELAGMLAGTSICFDVSIFEMFGPLSWGGCVHLIGNALEMPLFRGDADIKLAGSVPSAMAELAAAGGLPMFATTINLAGEPVPAGLADLIYRHSGAQRITNLYGPSEDTTFSSMALLKAESKQLPSIGRPVANTRFYVLDDDFRPVPLGAVGQVYIAGDGISRGYLGRPDMTAERFLPDPLSSGIGARMYRTGDLARLLMNGEFFYLGRVDHQVKIRGFRVELGEIEAVLREQNGVAHAVAVGRSEDPQLTAYLVPDRGMELNVTDIETAVRRKLPSYMVPSAFIILESLPVLPNGKVDRSALPAPNTEPSEESPSFVAPRSEMEAAICEVVRDALKLPRVGIHDHFFSDLGAHSVSLIHVAARLRDGLSLPISVIELFQFPSVATLAAHLAPGRNLANAAEVTEQAGRRRQDSTERRRQFRKEAAASVRGRER